MFNGKTNVGKFGIYQLFTFTKQFYFFGWVILL
jgi:hypothetical protein